jgi:hypothetical protein
MVVRYVFETRTIAKLILSLSFIRTVFLDCRLIIQEEEQELAIIDHRVLRLIIQEQELANRSSQQQGKQSSCCEATRQNKKDSVPADEVYRSVAFLSVCLASSLTCCCFALRSLSQNNTNHEENLRKDSRDPQVG